MVNIVEIVDKLPIGTKLYSTICGECTIKKIYEGLGFDVISKDGTTYNFSYDGRFNLNGECCIFPSKENRDWDTFRPFKDGDILTYTSNHTTTFIYRNKDNEPHLSTSFYVACNDAASHNFLIYNKYTLIALNENCDVRLATEDEKIKLFDAIKANGYKWNAETKTLEKLIVPKFKASDQIVRKNSITNSYIVNSVSSEYYGLVLPDRTGVGVLNVCEQDDWELLLPTHKFKVGDRIKRIKTGNIYEIIKILSNCYITNYLGSDITILFNKQDEYELVPNKFDISNLKPFDRLLVKRHNTWQIAHFGYFKNGVVFTEMGQPCNIDVIPYNDETKHLLGTCDDYDGFYKWWE